MRELDTVAGTLQRAVEQWSSGAHPAKRNYYTHIFHLHNEKDFDKSRIVPVPGKIV